MKRYFLDTNVLVLLLVGSVHPDWLGRRKPVSDFDQEDFKNLRTLLEDARGFITLPYVLAETSNLIGFGKRNTATESLYNSLCSFMRQCDELQADSHAIIEYPDVRVIGLTDLAILTLVRSNATVVTVDYELHGRLAALGLPTENLRHRRRI